MTEQREREPIAEAARVKRQRRCRAILTDPYCPVDRCIQADAEGDQ